MCNLPKAISVLLTVRNKETVQINDDMWHNIELEPFLVEESTEYIKKVLGSMKITDAQIKIILELIGDKNEVIPFHLNKVVSILRNKIGSLEKALEKIRNSKDWLRNGFYDAFVKNKMVDRIFKFLPYFDPDTIDLSLLAEMIGQEENDDWEVALKGLEKDYIFKINADREEISVHRLLQKELSLYYEKKLKNKEITEIWEQFTKKLNENFKIEDLDSRAFEKVPYTHANRLIQTDWFKNQFPDSEIKAEIFMKMGTFFEQNNPIIVNYYSLAQIRIPKIDPERAKECFLKTLEIRKNLYKDNHPLKVQAYNLVGNAYRTSKDFDRALKYLKKALDMNSRLDIGDNQFQIVAHLSLGLVHYDMKEFDEALDQLNIALKIQRELTTDNIKALFIIYRAIGETCLSLKEPKPERAKECFLEILKLTEKLYTGDHPHKVQAYNSVGKACRESRDFKCALENLEKALDMNSKLKINPLQRDTHISFGEVYANLKEFDKALEHYNTALEIQQKHCTEDNELLANLNEAIGYCKFMQR